MPRFNSNIFKRLKEKVDNNNLSPVNNIASISVDDGKRVNKTDLGLKSIFKPVDKLVSLSDRSLPVGEVTEFVSEELLTSDVTEANESFDILDSAIDFTLTVVDDIYVETPDIRNIEYPKEIRGADFIGYDVDFNISFETINTSYVQVGIGRVKSALKTNDTKLSFNVKELAINYLDMEGTEMEDKIRIPFQLTPYNTKGRETVEGKTETFTILFDKGDLEIPRSVAVNRIVEGFRRQLDRSNVTNSKYLTHLVHLGDGDNKLIANWAPNNEDKSLILKLYEPIPTSVQPNQKLWISKIQSQPIIETITLVGEDVDYCPPLQGPNFSLEVDNGIGYQIYDNLLASGSSTSTELVNQYTNTLGIDTEKLSIQYVSGSDYKFENFVRFGSAEERIKNFLYKIQLIESYQETLSDLTNVSVEVGTLETEDGYVLLTEDGKTLSIDALSVTQQTQVQAQKVTDNINLVIRGFDGFEKFLYTANDTDGGYPKTGNVLISSTDSTVTTWYNSLVNYASNYDKNNVDYLVNNVPEYLRENYENEEYLLFLDMIGQHFDTIWAYINGISDSKKLEHKKINGISNTLVSHMLESMGWDKKRAYDSQYLWEYALGQYKDGTPKYDRSLKDANEEIWRRILNNLPYLLKHKGTARSLKAILATYGIPQSLLTIMEFGGPQDPTQGGTTSFTFEDRTAAIKLSGSQYIQTAWNNNDTPKSVELNVKFEEAGNYGLLYNVDGGPVPTISWKLEANQTTGSLGKIKLTLSGSSDVKELESSELRLFNDTYKQIAITQEENSPSHSFNLYVKEAKGDRLRINDVQTLDVETDSGWNQYSGEFLLVGGSGSAGLVGSIDEFRLWSTPLEDNVITNHTKIPDAINGNNYTASSSELLLRHDFEYPKNRHTSGDTEIINVSISDTYVDSSDVQVTSSIAVNFANLSSYPYNYESYERSVTAQVPSMGFNFANKIRFEDQTLVGNLSHKSRATKKSFDQSPVDSPKLGLFFSPTKELNMDILKSMGNFNIDNYIGDPRDEYNDEYTELNTLREYYFERINLNVQEYIQLVRNIDKSLFDVLEDLVPARAKVAKGLLIEPHILERSKQKWERPESERRDYESEINVDETNEIELSYGVQTAEINVDDNVTFEPTYDTYDGVFEANDEIVLTSDYSTYQGLISGSDDISLEGDYPTFVGTVDASVDGNVIGLANIFSFTFVGQDDGGFGLYGENSHGKVTTIDARGTITSSRQQIYGVDGTQERAIRVWGDPFNAGAYAPYIEYVSDPTFEIVRDDYPFSGPSHPKSHPGGKRIVEVTPLNGYFPSHYKFVKNHSEGFERSFFKGSQQTAETTPDGLSPVETFTTNPNILKVADTGRGSGEPILEVD